MPARVDDFHGFAVSRSTALFRTAYLLTGGDWHMAQDLTQEALSRLFAAWKRVQQVDNPDAYARTVLVRLFISHKRKKSSSEVVTDAPGEVSAPGVDPALRVTLLAALGALNATDRAVVVLRYWEDRSVEDAAHLLGLSAGAVRNRSLRALAHLRNALGESFPALLAA